MANKQINSKVSDILNEYAWQKRQLILFTPNAEHPQYQLFKKIELKYRLEFDDRKLHTWHIVANNKVKLQSTIRDDISNQDFRDHYNINKKDFRVLLIGYDQDEKTRKDIVDIDYLFSKIDQMPFRIQELKESGN